MKRIYLIRHCEANGQEPNAELSNKGLIQAQMLCNLLKDKEINHIVSSPYERAIKSIEPLAESGSLHVNTDDRLVEKKLCGKRVSDWRDRLKHSFEDLTVRYEGGESSGEAMNRGAQVIKELVETDKNNIVVVTHGALLILILKYFNNDFGYKQWNKLQNPDIYLLLFKENRRSSRSPIIRTY